MLTFIYFGNNLLNTKVLIALKAIIQGVLAYIVF